MPTTTSSEFISGLITFVRTKQGLTCKELADRLEKEYNYIWKVESGCKKVSTDFLDLIIQALNLNQLQFWAYTSEYILYLQQQQPQNLKQP